MTQNATGTCTDRADWASIVERIRGGDPTGAECLYRTLTDKCSARLRWGLAAQGVEDGLHDIVVDVLQAIRAGTLREPARLMGFTKILTQRKVFRHIRKNIAGRERLISMASVDYPSAAAGNSPDAAFSAAEPAEELRRTLQCIRPRDRDLLTRYYCLEQTPALICQEMNLTPTQFRLYKSRALARCAAVALRSRKDSARRKKPLLHISGSPVLPRLVLGPSAYNRPSVGMPA